MLLSFDVANVFVCVFYVCLFMLIYRMVYTCQVQNVSLRQGMSDLTSFIYKNT